MPERSPELYDGDQKRRCGNHRTRKGKAMNVEVAVSGSVKSVEALARFLKHLEVLVLQPVETPKVMMADDGVIYVKARFATEEEAWSAGEKMAEAGADIVEETDVLVALAPCALKSGGSWPTARRPGSESCGPPSVAPPLVHIVSPPHKHAFRERGMDPLALVHHLCHGEVGRHTHQRVGVLG